MKLSIKDHAAHLLVFKERNRFDVEAYCFPEQLQFIKDTAPFTTACCSRRSGKTVACASDLIATALEQPGIQNLYLTLSRKNAKRIIWPELLKLNRLHKLGGKPNETDLVMTFPNESVIIVSGAKDKSEIENYRGLPFRKVYIDETQAFRDYLGELIDDVLAPALYDYAGQLRAIGTPGPVPAGFFHGICHSDEWSHHSWTMFQNPWIEKKSGMTVQSLIERDMKRKGVTIDDPGIQRECFGRWVVDPNALVFRYDASKNDYQDLPPSEKKWESILGVDLGYDDADAIAVIQWNEKTPKAYLREEKIQRKQGITELVGQIDAFIKKYDPMKIVMDTGGLGKKIAEEIRKRYSIPIQAAEKIRKIEYIEILNDAMRTGNFYAKRTSRFAQDTMLVEWDREADPEKPKISDTYHSDICDAVLYAYREALNWLHVPEKPKPVVGKPEWFRAQEEEMERQAEDKWRQENEIETPEGLEPSDEYWAV